MKCVVTGGTGFLGSCLTRRLQEAGHEVTVVSRQKGHDIRQAETLIEPFKGAQTVFHLAALVQSRPGPFESTNLEGLENVLRACQENSVQRVVNVSSFTIFGPSCAGPHQESEVPRRQHFFHGYDETKYRGYRLAEKWRSRLPMNIVFPTVSFGPGPMTEGNILVRLLQRWKKLRLAALQRGGSMVWNFVFVEDVADGLMRCLKAPVGEDYILGGENRSIRGLFEAFRQVSGCRILSLGLPDPLFRAGAYLEDLTSRLGGFPPLVLPSTADFFLNDWQFSSEKASQQLGYQPLPLLEGLTETYRWMQSKGLA